MIEHNVKRHIRQLVDGDLSHRDLLIEHLHCINDYFGCLPKNYMASLADLMGLAHVEVYEVASFYHHFAIVEKVPDHLRVTIRVCDSFSCCMAGSADLLSALQQLSLYDQRFVIEPVPCVGRCEQAPVAVVHQNPIPHVTAEAILEAVEAEQFSHPEALPNRTVFSPVEVVESQGGLAPVELTTHPDWVGLDHYQARGGYALLAGVRDGSISTEGLMTNLANSSLRGLGGAGFPVGKKWQIVSSFPGPRYLAVNLDEGEPGTFKDRTYLERDPHRFLEGMLIAQRVVGIDRCYIYLRDEYHGCRQILNAALDELICAQMIEAGAVQVRRGAGAYICGEESAMIESIEGKRGEPRHRPPYVAETGLFGRPTLVHNFESLYWVRDISERGANWFNAFGRHKRRGLRSFSVSGRVNRPGVKIAPAGISVIELIDEYCGGMADGHTFYGYMPGGASGGILPAHLGSVPLDFDTLQPYGCFIGSAAVVVLSEVDRARDAALNVMQFFVHESCGQCTPCRAGCEASAQLMQAPVWDLDALGNLGDVMRDASICGLGQAAPNAVACVEQYFNSEVSNG